MNSIRTTYPDLATDGVVKVIFSRVDHKDRRWFGCQCQQCSAMPDDLVREALGLEPVALRDTLIVGQKISIDDDYGTETFVVSVFAETLLELRRYVRDNNPGSIPIYSDYDCTGQVCGASAKFIKIYKTGRGYTALVEISVTRDV